MTAAQSAVLSLCARALFGAPLDLQGGLDFSEVLQTARVQALTGVASEGLSDLPDEAVPAEVMREWQIETLAIIRKNAALLSAQSVLLAHCRALEVPAVILKGFSAAAAYPTPDLRASGDVDILVPQKRLPELCTLLESEGYERVEGLDEHHVAYAKDGVMLELHFKIPGMPEGPAGERLGAAFADLFERAETAELEGERFPVPAPRHQALILLLHIAKHLLDGGVGLRQVLDLALFADRHREVFDGAFLALLRECGLYRFAVALFAGCVQYLHLPREAAPWCEGADPATVETLFADFLTGANFGRGKAVDYTGSGMAHKGRRRGEPVFFAALRGVADMCRREWPASQKCGVLLCFLVPFWIIRRLLDRKQPRVHPFRMLRSAGKRAAFYDTLAFFEPEKSDRDDKPS